jgi:hypothetical protein
LTLSKSNFFDQFRQLHKDLGKLNIGDKKKISIHEPFPPTFLMSSLGVRLNEDQLQERLVGVCCILLNFVQTYFDSVFSIQMFYAQ